jgi:hypothetical protein
MSTIFPAGTPARPPGDAVTVGGDAGDVDGGGADSIDPAAGVPDGGEGWLAPHAAWQIVGV